MEIEWSGREQAIPFLPLAWLALYPLSYGRMERPVGVEPTSSRVADEVTEIFTTAGPWRAGKGEAGNRRCCNRPKGLVTELCWPKPQQELNLRLRAFTRRSTEETAIFTTAPAEEP